MEINKQYFYDILEKTIKIDSPTGYTFKVVDMLKKEVEKLGYDCYTTEKGNLVVPVGESEKALCVCAHLDTLGLMVRSVKPNGRLALTNLGGPLINTLDGEYCRVHTRDGNVYTGTILSNAPSVHVNPDASTLPRTIDNIEVRLDLEVKTKEDTLKYGINNGDIVAYDTKFEITDTDFIKSRFLDDKLSVGILMALLEAIKREDVHFDRKIYFIFTVYEEVGHGNSYIPSDVNEVLGVDMGCIGTDLACSEYDVSICAKDSSGPYDYGMVSKLVKLAQENKINYAVDIYPMYGSDVSCALRSGHNIKGALIGPGVHASHGMERSHYKACEATFKLLDNYINK